MHLIKLYKCLPGKKLLRTSSKEKNKNKVTFSNLDSDKKEKIEKSIRESLYEKPHSEMITMNFDNIKDKYMAEYPNDTCCELLKEFIKLEIRKFIERLRMFQREIPSNIEDMPDSEIKKKYFYDENKGLDQRIENMIAKMKVVDEVEINNNYVEVMKNDVR
ncbi:unnamed protein product [Meloidogyne enterolobii]|uniref:Uncharacterized protein n=1 Tax=Meloidogyne enterolobii TaxID=390850 RepID=A0ACB1ASJ0_MELEN